MSENAIIFRGKPTDRFKDYIYARPEYCMNGFVYGSLVISEDRYYICTFAMANHTHYINNATSSMVEVVPETVGQYSGLEDKNNKRIYEGDVVEFESHGYCDSKERGVVIFKDGCYGIAYIAHWDVEHGFDDMKFHRIGKKDKWQDMGASGEITYTYEVLGNVYDNSDLLGKAYDLMMGTDEPDFEEEE